MENEVKGENKNKVGIVVVIILCVLSIILGGIGGYLYFSMDRDDSSDEPKVTTNCITENNCVVEYYSGSFSYNAKFEYDEDKREEIVENKARIPQLNVNTEEAQKVNKAILDKFGDLIDKVKNKKIPPKEPYENYWTAESVDYKYMIKNDIVFIVINYGFNYLRGSGDVDLIVYYYDVKNDKVLTNTDVMNHFGITVNDLKTALKQMNYDEEWFKDSGYENISNVDFPVYPKDDNTFIVYFHNLALGGVEAEITK